MIKAAAARTVEAGDPARLRLFRASSSLTDVNAFSSALQEPSGMPTRVETSSTIIPDSLGETGCVISGNRSRFKVSTGGVARITAEMLGQEVHHVR